VESILQGFATPQNAWHGIYKALLWYAEEVPHIVEANSLREDAWRRRAKQVEAELAQTFRCAHNQVESQIDELMRHPSLRGAQRQNPLGIGFTCAVAYLLRSWVPSYYTILDEPPVGSQGRVFRNIVSPPRRTIDIVALRGNAEYAIVSTKWSIRHDRLRDLLDECTVYKNHRPDLKFLVVTNEFMPARLQQLIENPCIDKVFHINRDLVRLVNNGDGRLVGLEDLSDLCREFP
jgi:hypothetical protein